MIYQALGILRSEVLMTSLPLLVRKLVDQYMESVGLVASQASYVDPYEGKHTIKN